MYVYFQIAIEPVTLTYFIPLSRSLLLNIETYWARKTQLPAPVLPGSSLLRLLYLLSLRPTILHSKVWTRYIYFEITIDLVLAYDGIFQQGISFERQNILVPEDAAPSSSPARIFSSSPLPSSQSSALAPFSDEPDKVRVSSITSVALEILIFFFIIRIFPLCNIQQLGTRRHIHLPLRPVNRFFHCLSLRA